MMFSTVQYPTRVRSVRLTGLDPGPRLVPATLVTYSHLLPAPCVRGIKRHRRHDMEQLQHLCSN